MPTGLTRYQQNKDTHAITFSCYHRKPYLSGPNAYRTFEQILERTRQRHNFQIHAYVLMPEHVHLLITEPQNTSLATTLKIIKQQTSTQLKGAREHFWQVRYYDFNVYTAHKFKTQLDYIHNNPVTRALVNKPELWPWSSYSHYQTGQPGTVQIQSWHTNQARTKAPA